MESISSVKDHLKRQSMNYDERAIIGNGYEIE